MPSPFPSLGASKLLRKLERLGYAVRKPTGSGSHVWLDCDGRPSVRWAYHESRASLAPIEVKRVLCRDVGLSVDEALEVCNGR